ncbi:hypothetical protein L209DRAFT_159410 [Thermothelomyces heterothallicus CBS 203.75]
MAMDAKTTTTMPLWAVLEASRAPSMSRIPPTPRAGVIITHGYQLILGAYSVEGV